MLKIRLMRIGGKKRPFYRVVAVDERSKRTGGYIELLGTYNPLTEPKEIKLKQDRIDYWIKQGAQPSVGYLRIIGKAPQRLPQKPKKEKKEKPAPAAPTEPQTIPDEKTESAPETEEAASQPETPKEAEAPQESAKKEVEPEIAESTPVIPNGPARSADGSPVETQSEESQDSKSTDSTNVPAPKEPVPAETPKDKKDEGSA